MPAKVEISLGDRTVLLRTIKRRSIWTSSQRQHVTHAVGRNSPIISTWSCPYCNPQRLVLSIVSCNFGTLCYTMCPNDQLFLLMKPHHDRAEAQVIRPSSVILSTPQTHIDPHGIALTTADSIDRSKTATVLFRVQFKQTSIRGNRFYLKLVVQCLQDGSKERWMEVLGQDDKLNTPHTVKRWKTKEFDGHDMAVFNLNNLDGDYVLRLSPTASSKPDAEKLTFEDKPKRTRPPEPVGVQLLASTYAPGRGLRNQWMNSSQKVQ